MALLLLLLLRRAELEVGGWIVHTQFYCLALEVLPLELMADGYCADSRVALFPVCCFKCGECGLCFMVLGIHMI